MHEHQGDFILTDFRFAGGGTLAELRLHFTTLGTPRTDRQGRTTNAVLILHGTTGSGRAFLRPQFAAELFGPGRLLDADRHYIILPDGIGHGASSKPSDGLRAAFPTYGYRDMVRAQYELVTQGLGIDHLRLVMGTSMGGMHTWLWGQTYPGFMDGLVPLACLPAPINGRNRMLRRMVSDAIRGDPAWLGGDYREQPRQGLTTAVYVLLWMTSVPLLWQQMAPTPSAADALFDQMVGDMLARSDANDLLYQFEASGDYDPTPGLAQIQAPLLAVNSADDQVNPPELGILEEGVAQLPRGRALVLPISGQSRGHGSHSWPHLWQAALAEWLAEHQI